MSHNFDYIIRSSHIQVKCICRL